MGLKGTGHGDLVGPNHADSCERRREDLEATMGVVPKKDPSEGWSFDVIYMEWCTACGGAEWDYA